MGYHLPKSLSTAVSKNKDGPEPFQLQGPALDGEEVQRQNKTRMPERPIFRIGGSVIHENKTDNQEQDPVTATGTPSPDSRANVGDLKDASPASASSDIGPDLEKGFKNSQGSEGDSR